MYKIGAQFYIDKQWPRHLFIELTGKCNLKCGYCPRQGGDHMGFELFKSIIDEGRTYGPRSYSLHLFGEPLLYPKFFEAVEYIKKANKRNTVLLTTNGTLIERYVDELVASDINKCLWTYREEAKWSAATKDKLRKWKAFTIRLIEEVTPEEAKKEYGSWPRVEKRSLHNYGGSIDTSKLGGEADKSTASTKTRWPCYHLWLAPAVSWNGNVMICCADPKQRSTVAKFPETSIAEAWKMMEPMRQSQLRGEYTGICAGCDVWKSYPDLFFKWQTA